MRDRNGIFGKEIHQIVEVRSRPVSGLMFSVPGVGVDFRGSVEAPLPGFLV
ncbi:hypothetical protein AVEN_56286-1, partial [Araneus ventricosus]